jgi:flagellar basal body-associated protein FliL
MNNQNQNYIKKNLKKISWFLLIVFPILLIVGYVLYTLVPSLKDMQIVVIMIMVVVGGFAWLIMEYISKKIEEKRNNKPKKFDPFSD